MFRFKRFTVMQDQCAFKVGTDSILLGSWVEPRNIKAILDIGTGSGILALMMAQKTETSPNSLEPEIHVLDIEPGAIRQAKLNFDNSPWDFRFQIHEASLQEFADSTQMTFDLIVTNPPYYTSPIHPSNKEEALARNTHSLDFKTLADLSSKLLNKNGALNLILPFPESLEFREKAVESGLTLMRLTRVFGKPAQKKEIRHLMEWIKSADPSEPSTLIEGSLTLETDSHHVKTPEFEQLTSDFYLNSGISKGTETSND